MNGAKKYLRAAGTSTSAYSLVTVADENCVWVIDESAMTITSKMIPDRGIACQVTSGKNEFRFYKTTNFSSSDYATAWLIPTGEALPEIPETPELPPVVIYETPEEIVNAAYGLTDGETLSDGHLYTLTGVITSVDTAYSEQYKNVTVTIQIGDMAEKLIQCFRLKGEGADTIKVGDTITVTGVLKNYKGTIEFDAGATINSVVVA